MKNIYILPEIEIIEFSKEKVITTSFTINEFDDGALYDDKW